MIENLAYLPAVSPSGKASYTDPYYYVYAYQGKIVDEAKASLNYSKYGVLYNWTAGITACPEGWHLPTDDEWKTLEKFLGMNSSESDDTGLRNSGVVGYKLKSISGWNNNGNGDNSSSFNTIPGGYRSYLGNFFNLGDNAFFWSSTSSGNPDYAISRYMYYDYGGVYRFGKRKSEGFSVRCLQN